MSQSRLRYTDEREKTYGLTGMAITLVALDGEDYLGGIDVDADPSEAFIMSPDFNFRGNPRMSAKILWSETLKELRLAASIALGNIVCRRYCLQHRGLDREDLQKVRSALRMDAGEQCSLENDEADRLFDSCYSYVDRLFRHPQLAGIAGSFADHLTERRKLSASETVEYLASLGVR